MEQIQLRKEILEQKERRRRIQAANKKHWLQKRLRRDSQRCWKNNQHQKPTPHVLTNPKSWSWKVTHLTSSHNPTHCSLLNCHAECHPVPPQHQYHNLVAAPQAPSGRTEELQDNRPHQMGTAWASQAQEAGMLETGDSDTSVPTKIKMVKHFDSVSNVSFNF